MMDRRRFLLTSLAGAVVVPIIARAQQVRKPPRIGWLTDSVVHQQNVDAFREGMRALGYPNVALEFQAAAGEAAKLPKLAATLVALKVDLIITDGGTAALAAKRAISTIRVVMGTSGDPVADGIVASLARPGGNITGLSISTGVEIQGKRLGLLREAVPEVGRIAVMWNPSNPGARRNLTEAESSAKKLSVHIISMEARNREEIERAFVVAIENRAGALQTLADAFFWSLRSRIVVLATRYRLPAIYPEADFVTAGGLLAYGPSIADNFRRAAIYVDRILKGTKPADLPIEQPTTFELVINLKTAKALGLTIPPSLLARANRVIE
jgi:putative tryptophan/tyrosine transport system substrate-binding protein